LAGSLAYENCAAVGREIEGVWKSTKYVLSTADGSLAACPVHSAGAAQDYEHGLFALRGCLVTLSSIETAHKKTHPLPVCLLPGQAQELARLAFGKPPRGNDELSSGHEALRKNTLRQLRVADVSSSKRFVS